METIHQRIKAARELKGLSMEAFALAVGVKWQTVQQWENGKTAPKRARADRVAKELGMTTAQLLVGNDALAKKKSNISKFPEPAKTDAIEEIVNLMQKTDETGQWMIVAQSRLIVAERETKRLGNGVQQ